MRKQILSLLLILTMVVTMFPFQAMAAEPGEAQLAAQPAGYIGVDVGPNVPASFQNDLWTQYDFKELAVGGTATITPRRVLEAVVDTTGNDLEMPHFNYSVIYGDSVALQGGSNVHEGGQGPAARRFRGADHL